MGVPGQALKPRAALTIAALGVVYGDIGTSPLYALRECFVGVSSFPVDHHNVFGILSLMTWSLVIIVAVKYLRLVLRADNDGEGGILALAHLVVPEDVERWSRGHWVVVAVGLFGAALLFGDGILTPALSVLSAVEGLGVAAPQLERFVVPITVGILAALFGLQRFGTGRVGRLFGPVTLVWFATLGLLGLRQIVLHPHVLYGFSPHHAVLFFQSHGLHGTLILGAVFLTVTGAEACCTACSLGQRPQWPQAWAFPTIGSWSSRPGHDTAAASLRTPRAPFGAGAALPATYVYGRDGALRWWGLGLVDPAVLEQQLREED